MRNVNNFPLILAIVSTIILQVKVVPVWFENIWENDYDMCAGCTLMIGGSLIVALSPIVKNTRVFVRTFRYVTYYITFFQFFNIFFAIGSSDFTSNLTLALCLYLSLGLVYFIQWHFVAKKTSLARANFPS